MTATANLTDVSIKAVWDGGMRNCPECGMAKVPGLGMLGLGGGLPPPSTLGSIGEVVADVLRLRMKQDLKNQRQTGQ